MWFFEISWFNWIYLMILEKMTSCLWKLELGFWTYGWIRLLDPSGPNVVSKLQSPRSRHFLRFHDLIGFIHVSGKNEILFVKIGIRVQDLRLVCLLVPIGPNVVSRPQAPRSINFLRFHKVIILISWFWRKWRPVCEN